MFPSFRSARALLLPSAFIAFSAVSVVSCGDDPPPVFRSAEPRAARGTYRLYDADGRELLLHGVNARIDGIFDNKFDDGRTELYTVPPFVEEDCRLLGEDLGLNHLRLPVNWSGIEPHNDEFNEAYIDRILEIAAMCERHGVYTIVDFHQDGFSKEIGEDGAPLWAINPAPTQLLEGPLTDLGERRMSTQVVEAFKGFYRNYYGGWEEFAEMQVHVARRIEGHPGILGIELHNEPMLLADDNTLIDFHRFLIDELRRAAPTMALAFEPSGLRNIADADLAEPQIERSNVLYAPHLYSDVFENGWVSEDVELVRGSVERMRTEADKHRAALYVGEFGHDDTARGALYVRTAIDAFDAHNASWAYWVYEEWNEGGWGGLYDFTYDPPGRVALRSGRADLLARAYPAAIAGHVVSFHYDVGTRRLEVVLTATTSGEHVIAAPMRTYPQGVTVLCDGTPVPARFEAGRAYAACRGTSLVLEPAQ